MEGEQEVLSARLEVRDSFTSQMDKFINSTNKAESAFDKFINNINKSATVLEKTLDVIDAKINSVTTKITAQTDVMTSKITSSANKIQETQNKTISDLTNKYKKMGKDVSDVFKIINKDAETLAKSGIKIGIGGTGGKSSNSSNTNNTSVLGGVFGTGDKTTTLLSGILTSGFTGMLGSLGLIGAGIVGTKKVLDMVDGWLQQGFSVLNTISGNLLSPEGLYNGVLDAGQFEQNRVSMDILYGNNKDLGQYYYKLGVTTAKNTTYGEKDTGELQRKLAGAKISYNQDQLSLLADIASLRPEQPLSKVGFSIVDAMSGRTTSLKSMYMLDNKEINKYLQSLRKTNPNDYSKWKDAFNSKGTVNNKQEYFDLLTDYVTKETNYKGLNAQIMGTAVGKLDRLQGNWETLKAQILGIDANNTGNVVSGTVMDYFGKFLDNMDSWLKQSSTINLLNDFSKTLGKVVGSIADAVEGFMSKINWDSVGSIITKIGDSIVRIVNTLASSSQFEELLDKLPDLISMILNSKIIDTVTNVKTGSDLATGNIGGAMNDKALGTTAKIANDVGVTNASNIVNQAVLPSDTSDLGIPIQQGGYSDENYWRNFWSGGATNSMNNIAMYFGNSLLTSIPSQRDKMYLTDANASTYLNQNANLTDDQRNQIKNMMESDTQPIYNISVGTIQADNFDEIVSSIQKIQANQK